jgi:hypothetical protein
MGPASSRHAARTPRRPAEAPARAVRVDARFERLTYLHGWWYGSAEFLGFPDVRIRLPGDLGGPSARARAALLAVDRARDCLQRQIHPYLWAAFLAGFEARGAGRRRSRARRDDLGPLMHERYRVGAVCAGAYGEADLVELALEPRWEPGRVLGAYVQDNMLVEFRSSIGLWRTPQ